MVRLTLLPSPPPARRLLLALGFTLALCLCGGGLPVSGAVADPGFEQIVVGRTRFRGTEGALTTNDAIAIKGLAESLCLSAPGHALRYAEVGSYLGLSATIVATCCAGATVFCHDLFPMAQAELGDASHPPPEADLMLVRFWDGVARNGLEGRVIPMRGRSAETLQVHKDGSLDMGFVDGDHSYAGTLADLRLLWTKVRKGGMLLLHDAVKLPDGTDHEVRQAAIAFCAEVGAKFFDVEFTWGLVAIPKDAIGSFGGEIAWK